MNEIFMRRSVREYSDEPVSEQELLSIVRAGMQAPSAHNERPWEFITVTDRRELFKLGELGKYTKMVPQAGAAIVLLAREEMSEFWQQDMGACTQNMLLEAASLGLGACWLGVYPSEERQLFLRRQFSIPSGLRPFCVISLGHVEENKNVFVDRFEPQRLHKEKY
ncbi:MAG: nitroreductase family protein [Oscillospiraceae bacterium]